MFKKSQEELKALGAHITTAEIKQQPELWESTFGIYQENLSAIKEFVERARNLGEGRRTRVAIPLLRIFVLMARRALLSLRPLQLLILFLILMAALIQMIQRSWFLLRALVIVQRVLLQ